MGQVRDSFMNKIVKKNILPSFTILPFSWRSLRNIELQCFNSENAGVRRGSAI
jgi:hypothetical protein